MNLAEFVAQFLRVNGVKRLFGLPGGENVLFLEAVRDAGLEFVLCHHEAAAGFAAGVTGQLTGIPGVCLATVGPGAVNLVAATAASTLERSPMLAITADIDTRARSRVRHMKVDLTHLFRGTVKDSLSLEPDSIKGDLESAWSLALEPPMGAVHLALAPDLAAELIESASDATRRQAPPRLDDNALRMAMNTLKSASDVIILAGIGVEAASAQNELVDLAEAWQLPVAVTPKAKGHFPESHPLYSGCYSAYCDGALVESLAGAGVILGVGLDSVDFVSSSWAIQTPVVNLNSALADDPSFGPVTAVNGDLKAALAYLASQDRAWIQDHKEAQGRAQAIRNRISQDLNAVATPTSAGTCSIANLIDGMRSALPEDGVVTVDVGIFKLVFLQRWRTDRPKSLFVANGLSAMGYAVPGAIAIKLEEPERPVVAIAGDGALLMYAGELATVARLGVPIVVLVVVDNALSLIRLKQKKQDVHVFGTEFDRVDYKCLAGSFGLDYRLIDGSVDPEVIFLEALGLSRPVLVEARVDAGEYDRFR